MQRVLILTVTLLVMIVSCAAQETKLKWFGHAAFSITTPNGKVLLIDPWLSNPSNPDVKDGKDPLAALPKVDYILLTHGHRDHVGEAAAIANKTGAVLISNPELAGNLVKLADFPAKSAQTDNIMGIGGEIKIADGEVTIAMTPAVHSSSVFNSKAGPNDAERVYGGNPAGFVIIIKNGPTFYHSGDTAYFKDMEMIGESYAIDVAILNVGGHFGMEPRMAAKAARSVKAKLSIPQHYEPTADGSAPNVKEFSSELKKFRLPVYVMYPGDFEVFKGKVLLQQGPER